MCRPGRSPSTHAIAVPARTARRTVKKDYENYVAFWLMLNGYGNIELTPKTSDYGADILCTDRFGRKWAVQCKLYSKPVGYKAVEEAIAGAHYYQCHGAMVVTNSTFTKQAKKGAKKTGVVLWQKVKFAIG